MKFFATTTIAYFLTSGALVFALRGSIEGPGVSLLDRALSLGDTLSFLAVVPVAVVLGAYFTSPNLKTFGDRLVTAIITCALCLIFLAGFTGFKTSMPLLAQQFGLEPFFADPFFAELDRALHFGIDPWRFTHAFSEQFSISEFTYYASIVYGPTWGFLAFYFPALMVLFGEHGERLRRYQILYILCWIGLGNILAFAGLSAGPVYYDRLHDVAQFTDLQGTFSELGWHGGWFGIIQDGLWDLYVNEGQAVGSGISAFPSLHVASMTVVVVYLCERSKWFLLPAIILLSAVVFVSVWCGYHYAIDGYFSIIAIVGMNWALKSGFLRFLVSDPQKDATT